MQLKLLLPTVTYEWKRTTKVFNSIINNKECLDVEVVLFYL